jgi:hypothetical protein
MCLLLLLGNPRASTRFVRGSAYAPDFFVLRTLY